MSKLVDKITTFTKVKDDNGISVYDRFNDYFWHYMDELNGSKINPYDSSIKLSEKESNVNKAMIKEICANANVKMEEDRFNDKVWAQHPLMNWATYAVIGSMVEAVLPDTLINDIGAYTEMRYGADGDSFAFDVEPRDLFFVTKTGNNKRHGEIQEQNNGQVTVVPHNHQVTVGVSLYRVLAGKESLAKFVVKAIRSIESAMTYDAYTAFTTAAGTLSSYTNRLYFSGYSQTNYVTGAETVSAYNGGARAIWMGTQLALENILPADANYRYDLNSDYATMGYIPTFAGYDILRMPQKADHLASDEFSLLLDNDKLFCISPSSQKLIKLCVEGGMWSVVDAAYANADLRQAATFNMSWGVGTVWSPVMATIAL